MALRRCVRTASCAAVEAGTTKFGRRGAPAASLSTTAPARPARPEGSQDAKPTLDFSDAKAVFQDQSTLELLRSYIIFKACTVRPLVKNAGKLVKLSNEVLGKQLTGALLKTTFFHQFVAGEDAATIKPTLSRLRAAGVGGILDYAAENDVAQHQVEGKVTAGPRVIPTGGSPSPSASPSGPARAYSASAAPPSSPPGFSSSSSGSSSSSASKAAELDANLAETVGGLATARAEGGFAAVKVTALAQPELLQRVSEVMEGSRRAFRGLVAASAGLADPGQASVGSPGVYTDSRLTEEQFTRALKTLSSSLPGVKAGPIPDPARLFRALDMNGDGAVDYWDFCDGTGLAAGTDLGNGAGGAGAARETSEAMAAAAGFPSALAMTDALGLLSPVFRPELRRALPGEPAALSSSELAEWQDVLRRADTLAAAARAHGVTIMVDAEQTYLQPAIEGVGVAVSRRYNRPQPGQWRQPEVEHVKRLLAGDKTAAWPYTPASTLATANTRHHPAVPLSSPAASWPVVYNTYQAYRRDCQPKLVLGMARAEREGYLFGVKLVRGAYMIQERARAAELGYNDPIHASIADTHACYDGCTGLLLERVVARGRGEAMVASHNEGSVRAVVEKMSSLGLDPSTCGVSFGQLLGMCDFMSFTLGRAGYRAYKYVPYGPVQGVLPYLIRRAQENSDMLSGGVAKELRLLRAELGRRVGLPVA